MNKPKDLVFENFNSQSPYELVDDPTKPTWDDMLAASATSDVDPQDDNDPEAERHKT